MSLTHDIITYWTAQRALGGAGAQVIRTFIFSRLDFHGYHLMDCSELLLLFWCLVLGFVMWKIARSTHP